MSRSDDRAMPVRGDNPFPGAAVARVLKFDDDTLTVETRAIADATRQLREYLTRDRAATQRAAQYGAVVAIVGDYGTGKSHLLGHMLHEARTLLRASASDPEAQVMYIDAPAGSFLELYRGSFMRRLERTVVTERVREYYADIVAESLEDGPFPLEVTDRLRSGQIDPRRFVEQFGLIESTFLSILRERLRTVTDNEQFGTALMLLLRGGYGAQLWEWFGGGGPDPVLSERGITTPIDTDIAALEAIGVFAVLLGGRDHRFVLAIDELEQVLSASDRPPEETIDAFKTLLSVTANAGVFLVLAGLPDFLNTLGTNVRDRIGPVLHPSDLSADDVAHYIRMALPADGPQGELGPFSEEVIGYLTWLAGGNARRIIQLCHTSYRLCGGERPVSEAMLRQAAQEHFQVTKLDDIRAHARRVLDIGGHQFQAAHRMGDRNELLADFWVIVGAEDSGCAIILTDSVLDERRAQSLATLAERYCEEVPQSRTLLVVNGYLVPAFSETVSTAFTDPMIDYEARRFAEDLEAALFGMSQRLRAGQTQDPLGVIGMHLDRMIRMQSSTQRYVEQLALQVETMQTGYDRQFAGLRRELESRPYLGARGSVRHRAVSADDSLRLPDSVEGLFAHALGGLVGLNDIESLLNAAFETGQVEPASGAPIGRTTLRQFSEQSAFDAVGVAALVQTAVIAFRSGIRRWYGGLTSVERQDEPGDVARKELRRLCRSYDAVLENLPIFRLNELTAIATRSAVRTGTRSELLGWSTLPARQADIRAMIDSLATEVFQALTSPSAPGSARGPNSA